MTICGVEGIDVARPALRLIDEAISLFFADLRILHSLILKPHRSFDSHQLTVGDKSCARSHDFSQWPVGNEQRSKDAEAIVQVSNSGLHS